MGEDRPLSLTRRAFLGAGAAAGLAAAVSAWDRLKPKPRPLEGGLLGADRALGHRLRSGGFPKPSRTVKTGVVIAGGGIAGLSAGWKLARSGFKSFTLLELEAEAGGNSRSGENSVSGYPWGAHYLPFPQPESKAVHELLRELKVQIGTDHEQRAVYDDRYVCFAPDERLFAFGRWQDGLFPRLGASARDLEQHASFERLMASYRRRRGSDGRRAFALPMELSSRDPDLLALDRVSMAEFLRQKGFDSPRLLWHVDYACRDDFGSLLGETSAWAGIHYFAARGEGPEDQVLTWPEGNGWLARRLADALEGRIETGALVFNVEPREGGVIVDWLDSASGAVTRVEAKAALLCMPQFASARVFAPWRAARPDWLSAFQYSPWVVANITVDDPPAGKGSAPAWDNVLFQSPSLGYVRATHQSLARHERASVWTYYLPLTGKPPAQAREEALATPWSRWAEDAVADLSRAHPGLREHVRRVDVMLWGHAMVKPSTGFLWGADRKRAGRPHGRVFFGHSDLSGFSLFEEAQYRGIVAAQDAMKALGHPFTPSA